MLPLFILLRGFSIDPCMGQTMRPTTVRQSRIIRIAGIAAILSMCISALQAQDARKVREVVASGGATPSISPSNIMAATIGQPITQITTNGVMKVYQGFWAPIPVVTSVDDDLSGKWLRISTYPNPFREHTTIDVGEQLGGDVDVFVFDMSGRMVRTMKEVVTASVPQRFTWDGADADGRPVAAGTYIIQVRGRSTVTGERVRSSGSVQLIR